MSDMENPIQSDVPDYGRPKVESQETNQEEPARLGPAARLTGVLFSPGETFQDINRKPTWLVPFLITILITLAFSVFFEWRAKPDWDRFFNTMAEKRVGKPLKDLPPEQQDQIHKQLEWQKKFAKTDLTTPLTIVIAVGKFFVFYVFAFLIPTGVFALGMMFIQAQTTFKKILSVVAWSWCATGLVGIVVAIAALMV
ncbi:MAG TPA: Yip1 family protein, partial [Blastocatellia bacterium]|nr:Yip1 family protein [Blastocatellia bacterium]